MSHYEPPGLDKLGRHAARAILLGYAQVIGCGRRRCRRGSRFDSRQGFAGTAFAVGDQPAEGSGAGRFTGISRSLGKLL